MPLLIGLLRDGGRQVGAAASALVSLCIGDPSAVKAAVDSGALEILAALLRNEDLSYRRCAISPLSAIICAATGEHKERALVCGVARLLADCFFEFEAFGGEHYATISGSALRALFPEDGDPVFLSSLVDQIIHCSTQPARLVEMLVREDTSVDVLLLIECISRSSDRHATLVAAGVPRAIVDVLTSSHERPTAPEVIAAGARVLLSLTPSGASVGEEAAAAGFDAARLRTLANGSPPDEPAAPATA